MPKRGLAPHSLWLAGWLAHTLAKPPKPWINLQFKINLFVSKRGLEPPWVAPLAPKASVSTNFTTSTLLNFIYILINWLPHLPTCLALTTGRQVSPLRLFLLLFLLAIIIFNKNSFFVKLF